MSDPALRVSLDLHAVGPRADAAQASGWLALNVAAAYDIAGDPSKPGDERLVPALMPPSLLDAAAGVDKEFVLILFSSTAYRPFVLAAPAPPITPFATRVGARLQTDAQRMAARGELVLGWAGSHMDDQGDVESATATGVDSSPPPQPHPWFGIASLLASLPASLAQPLRSRWYLPLDLVPIQDAMALDPTLRHIVVAPRTITDANRQETYALVVELPNADAEGRVVLRYTAATHPDLLAHTVLLDAMDLFRGAPEDPGDYWLKLEDSRHDSVAEIDQLLRNNGDPVTLAAIVGAEQLQRSLRSQVAEQRTTGAVVEAFRQAAAQVAGRLSTSERDQQAATFATDILKKPGLVGVESLVVPAAEAVAAWWVAQWQMMEAEIHHQRVAYADTPPLRSGQFSLDAPTLAAELVELVRGMLRLDALQRPVLPGEGIDFVVGAPDRRLVGYDGALNQKRTLENEMAHIGLLVRRSSTPDFTNMPWRIVTAGQPVLDETGALREKPWGSPGTLGLPTDTALALGGIALAYKDGVLRNDDTYRGQLMVGPSALAFLHADQGTGSDNPTGWTRAGEVIYASAAVRKDTPGWEHARAPALRYDDYYQLAAFMKDRGGGLPRAIAPTLPWIPDYAAWTVPASAATTIRFQRRVPVGGLNLKPGTADGWPAFPKGVVLLAAEWWQAQTGDTAAPPTLLLSRPVPGGVRAEFPGTLARYEFTVEPPRIDEHTLQRWVMPPVGAPNTAAVLDALKTELARIAELRETLQADPQTPSTAVNTLLPHDPAVVAALIRTQVRGPDGTGAGASQVRVHRFATPDPVLPFHKAALTICVANEAATPGRLVVPPPPPGHFMTIDISLLCHEDDHARFDSDALGYDTLDTHADASGVYRVHPGETVLLESVTSELPASEDLYAGFIMSVDASGRAIGTFQTRPRALAYVDCFELQRQRWVWRNLPYVTPGTAVTLERRLTSGLPLELASIPQEPRDAAEAVLTFDLLVAIDRGFVERPRFQARWPRTPVGQIASPAHLITDERDGQSAADYLRYALTVVSRYAAVLPPHQQRVVAQPPPSGQELHDTRGPWRRLAVRCTSSAELRALNILAVLPLTATPREVPDEHLVTAGISKDATPHLVILDEILFREYGPGEALRAQLDLEEIEIGDKEKRPVRYGPLPHKHLEPSGDTREFTDAQAEQEASLRLPVFGPFGFSLDRSGNEALANASAFVVYLPASVGPQWAAAVRFRRVLLGIGSDGTSEERVGPWSSAHLVYSLPDSRNLVKARGNRATLTLTVAADQQPTGAAHFAEADVALTPYQRKGLPPDLRIRQQYRYLLIVGRPAKDGGHGIDAFIPQHALWLDGPTTVRAVGQVQLAPSTALQGYVLEVELDGSFPGLSPLEVKADSLVALFKALLQTRAESGSDLGRDALGRITRMSERFAVDVHRA